MADISLTPRSPLSGWKEVFDALAPAVQLAETPVAQSIGRTSDAEAIARLDLPGVCELRRHDGEVAVWLGPTEWLLYCEGVSGHDFVDDVVSRAGDNAYVMDATGQRARLVLGGPHARTILAHGCAVDLSDSAFPPDRAVSTLVAQTGVVIHRDEHADTYTLFVRSSFADYLADWLVDAATEYAATTATDTIPST